MEGKMIFLKITVFVTKMKLLPKRRNLYRSRSSKSNRNRSLSSNNSIHSADNTPSPSSYEVAAKKGEGVNGGNEDVDQNISHSNVIDTSKPSPSQSSLAEKYVDMNRSSETTELNKIIASPAGYVSRDSLIVAKILEGAAQNLRHFVFCAHPHLCHF